jgi:hypothetical protein
MDGLKYIIGPSPCEMHEEERLVFASKEIERIGIALQTHVEKEKAKKVRKKKQSNKEEARKLLKILEAAGITPQEYVEAMKGT